MIICMQRVHCSKFSVLTCQRYLLKQHPVDDDDDDDDDDNNNNNNLNILNNLFRELIF